MRQITIDVDCNKFRLRGTGHWAEFGDAWLCTHDILHHLPTDKGRLSDELMTFGCEYWLEHGHANELLEGKPSTGVNLAGIEAALTGSPLKNFVFKAPALDMRRPPAAVMAAFEDAIRYLMADIRSLRVSKESWQSQRLTERILGPENQRNALAWLVAGYRIAQRRWPDPAKAQALFNKLEATLEHSAGLFAYPGRACLKFDLNEDDCTLTAANPHAARALIQFKQFELNKQLGKLAAKGKHKEVDIYGAEHEALEDSWLLAA